MAKLQAFGAKPKLKAFGNKSAAASNGKPKFNSFGKKHSVTATAKDVVDATGVTITNLRQIDGSYWAAHVTYKGFKMEFHNKFGAWYADVNDDYTEPVFSRDGYHGGGKMRTALPYVAELLAGEVPKPKKAEPEKPKRGRGKKK